MEHSATLVHDVSIAKLMASTAPAGQPPHVDTAVSVDQVEWIDAPPIPADGVHLNTIPEFAAPRRPSDALRIHMVIADPQFLESTVRPPREPYPAAVLNVEPVKEPVELPVGD